MPNDEATDVAFRARARELLKGAGCWWSNDESDADDIDPVRAPMVDWCARR